MAFTSVGIAFQQIDVPHEPSFAEASEGILHRTREGANPAKRVSANERPET